MSYYYDGSAPVSFDTLQGKTLRDITVDRDNDVILFAASDKSLFKMHHRQDCCEYVYIKDIVGDLQDLIGTPILLAEMVSNLSCDEGAPKGEDHDESYTWTFYKLRTIKGSVDISWYGSSNGYYSESVDFVQVR